MTRIHLPTTNWTKNLRRLPASKGRLTALATLAIVAALAVGVFLAGNTGTAQAQSGPPGAPEGVSLKRNTQHDQLVVRWQPPSDVGGGIDAWQIECNTDSTFQSNADAAGYSPAATGNLAPGRSSYAYTCLQLTPNTRYYARVGAVGSGFGPYASTASFLATRSVASISTSGAITEGDDAVFTVTLSPAPAAGTNVTVNIRSVSGNFGVSTDNHTVTVGTGGTGTLTLSTTDDSTVEAQGSITARVHPAPSGYAKGEPNQVVLAVNDNDAAVTATIAADSATITEGEDADFTVTLDSAPSSNTRVYYDITVSGDFGVTAATGQFVVVRSSATTAGISLTTTDDILDEANGSVTVTLTAGSAYTVGTSGSAAVTVNDNDTPGVTVSETALTLTEGGATGSYTVVLDTQPGGNVVITATSPDTGAVTASPASLTFTTGNWSTAQTVTVTAVEDDDTSNESVTIANAVNNAQSSNEYDGVAVADVTVTVDDDSPITDYDSDNDGLIDVDSLAKLNAIRYDLDGDGTADDAANNSNYAAGFPNPAADQCDDGDTTETETCEGYELTADLTFAAWDSSNPYWNSGAGWTPIGGDYDAIFEGNNQTITGLFITSATLDDAGLFAVITDGATVRNLVLANVDVTGDEQVGGLAGTNSGAVSNVTVSGTVSGDYAVGGLVGYNTNPGTGDSSISGSGSTATVSGSEESIGGLVGDQDGGRILRSYASGAVSATAGDTPYSVGGLVGRLGSNDVVAASYASGAVSGDDRVGGLVGDVGGAIIASYASGAVSGVTNVGGLAGRLASGHSVTASYATGAVTRSSGSADTIGGLAGAVTGDNITNSYWDTESTGHATSAGGTGKTGAELRTPTAYGTAPSIYSAWNVDVDGETGNDDPWDFGAGHNLPELKSVGGHQKGPDPVRSLATALNGGNIRVTWTAPAETGAGTINGYEHRHSSDSGTTWTGWVFTPSLTFTISAPQAATTYTVQVRAVSSAAHQGQTSSVTYTPETDYDSDNDGLIDVDSLAKLNAIRYDLDGNGSADDSADNGNYTAGFPNPVSGMGCPSGCTGYELTADLDFDENNDDAITETGDPTYWNGGKGWAPFAGEENIGSADGFRTTFEGNGNTISNLFIDRSYYDGDGDWDGYGIGLIGRADSTSIIRNLNLEDVDVAGSEEAGALVGFTSGQVINVSVTGTVTGDSIDVGGVVGFLSGGGRILNSSFDGTVNSTSSHVGGLAGSNLGTIRHSSAEGSVTGTGGYATQVGGLVGSNAGDIAGSYATNNVTSNGGFRVGGLVGMNGGPYLRGKGSIITSYSSGNVSSRGDVGGLVGENFGSVSTSYSTGAVQRPGTGPVGGLVGRNEWTNELRRYGIVADSYWNDTTSWNFGVSQPDDANGNNRVDSGETNSLPESTLAALRSPTGYTGIYANWNVDVDGNGTNDTPWCFGGSGDLPSLRVAEHNSTCPGAGGGGAGGEGQEQEDENDGGGQNPPPPPPTDYDADNDGLIEVSNLVQLNAIRHDVDGDGSASNAAYADAYPNAAEGMGCPSSGCTGYELTANLDFNDSGDYGNWTPIGSAAAPFTGTLEGNGHTIANLSISRSASNRVGFFGQLGAGGLVSGVGLVSADVTGRNHVGALVGRNDGGRIVGSYTTGSVTGRDHVGGLAGSQYVGGGIFGSYSTANVDATGKTLGGLVGRNARASIVASYATGAVNCVDGCTGARGGLVGNMRSGGITASYATGTVSAGGGKRGGLVGEKGSGATVANSYWDTETSGVTSSGGGEGKTTSELQAPTGYTGIYETWGDHDVDGDGNADAPWDFGSSSDYPTLRSGL